MQHNLKNINILKVYEVNLKDRNNKNQQNESIKLFSSATLTNLISSRELILSSRIMQL